MRLSLSFSVAAAALSSCCLLASVVSADEAPAAPLYIVRPPFSAYQAPPLVASNHVAEMSYNSFQSLLTHAVGASRNAPALGIQEWASSAVMQQSSALGSSKSARVVAAIDVLGVEPQLAKQLLPLEPTFLVNNLPSTAEHLVETLRDVQDAVTQSEGQDHVVEIAKTFSTGALEAAVADKEIASEVANPRSLADSVATFRSRYADYDTEIFDVDNEADAAFITEMEYVADVFDVLAKSAKKDEKKVSQFTGFVLGSLQGVAKKYSVASEQYNTASLVLKHLLSNTVIPQFLETYGEDATVAVLVSDGLSITPGADRGLHRLQRRATPPAAPVCPASEADCNSAFNSCNGRGQCRKTQQNCFKCSCTKAKNPNSTSPALVQWAGDSCEYLYTGPQFFLLFGTGIAMILAVLAISLFVVSMGGAMDSGPMAASSPAGIKTD